MKFVNISGLPLMGTKKRTINKELFARVRKAMNKTKEELSDKDITKVIKLGNKEIVKWIVENPEGFQMHKTNGYLVPSKHLPKEFREDKEEKIKKIESLDVPESVRRNYLKRYNVDIGRRINMQALSKLKELIPQINLHSFFYTFRIMWFNKRNTNIFKARAYRFEASKLLKSLFYKKIMEGKDYYTWNFDDFYLYKIHPDEVKPNKWLKNKIKEDGI